MNEIVNPTVIDFFCGAGGFSEGFSQQGFRIVMGIDFWQPAIDTFNHNFRTCCVTKNILEYEDSIEEIYSLPNTDVIIGSPPCVSFSNSNKSGSADKSLGIRLTETFLRIVVVKKFQKDSILKAWFMENVANSVKYLKDHYTFKDLNLTNWAYSMDFDPNKNVISIVNNNVLINSADYGTPQRRKRLFFGEIVKNGCLVIPGKTNSANGDSNLPKVRSVREIKRSLPKPSTKSSYRRLSDLSYPSINIRVNELTDHFYDTGLFECQWENSKYMKKNHPFMGKMAFPENEHQPSRTITATNIGTSREAIIYKSEYNRKGDGEYRVPTTREMACLMGFPLTYQFLGKSESSKARLVGNAVCPNVSSAFARTVREELMLPLIENPIVQLNSKLEGVYNLNTFKEATFKKPPRKNKGSKFRRHIFKDGNLTVTLSNYPIEDSNVKDISWETSIQYGNGKGFPNQPVVDNFYKILEPIIEGYDHGIKFKNYISNGFSEKIGDCNTLQKLYEEQRGNLNGEFGPKELLELINEKINQLDIGNEEFIQDGHEIFIHKSIVPLKQLYALYAINRISSKVNTP